MEIQDFDEIITDRLRLRKIVESDSEEVLFLRSDETVNQYIWRPENRRIKNTSDAANWIKKVDLQLKNNECISWGITLLHESKLIGSICLWNFTKNNTVAEVGYDLNPAFHRKGIMDEALKEVVGFGFNSMKFDKIEAYTHRANEGSKRLLLKNDFSIIEERKDAGNDDNVVFEIIRNTFLGV